MIPGTAHARTLVVHALLFASLAARVNQTSAAAPGQPREAPVTAKRPVTDELHGVKIVDDYRWLENWDDPAVKAWSESQNAYTRATLDALPCAAEIRTRATELENSVGVEYGGIHPITAGGKTVFFAVKNQPPKQQPLIVALASIDNLAAPDNEKVILDPNEIDKSGGTSFDFFEPSPDGRMIAISLSEGGSESGDVHIFDVGSGKELKGDRVPRVNGGTAGGSLAWTPDSKGFYYTRYPRVGERPEEDMGFYNRVYFHALGTSTQDDRYEAGRDYPKIAEIMLETSDDGRWVVVNVQNGDGGEFIQELKGPDGKWTRLSEWKDRVVEAKFGHDASGKTALYLVSRKDAPMGKVLRLSLNDGAAPTLEAATVFIPEQKDASVSTDFSSRAGLYLTPGKAFTLYQVGGPNELRVFGVDGKAIGTVHSLPVSTVENVQTVGVGDDIVFQNDSYVAPPAYFRYDGKSGEVAKTGVFVKDPPGMIPLQVTRDFAVSKDGTKVPVNIVTRTGYTPDGKTPTLVWGYGGYGVNETPGFSRNRMIWLENGGIFVLANIRGGGEYGEKWHLEGNLTRKQNVFDDFYAACRYMIDKGFTNKDKLAIIGGSNGGLLMGATFTQHPDLCKAVVSSVGIYDMLRVELSPNGAFNITEFGTVKDKAQFEALYAYSPYHHVQDGAAYPSILFMTGANDPRVDPMQSRKMTARMQAASPRTLTLLRTSGNTGHGAGTPLSARIEQTVDRYAFLFSELGMTCGKK